MSHFTRETTTGKESLYVFAYLANKADSDSYSRGGDMETPHTSDFYLDQLEAVKVGPTYVYFDQSYGLKPQQQL